MEAVSWSQEVNNPNFVDSTSQQQQMNFDSNFDFQYTRNCVAMSSGGKTSRRSSTNFQITNDCAEDQYDNFSTNLDDLFETITSKNIYQTNVKQEFIIPNVDRETIKLSTDRKSQFDDQNMGTVINGPESMNESIELYHDLIMRHLVQDIISTSSRLKICCDPRLWTVEQSQIWLLDVARQYKLPQVPSELFMPGNVLCSIDLETLKMIFPGGAELIHAQLNLWATATDYKVQTEPSKIKQEEISNNGDSQFCCQALSSVQGRTAYDYCGSIANQNKDLLVKMEPKTSPLFSYSPVPSAGDIPMTSPSCDSGFSTDSEEFYNDPCPGQLQQMAQPLPVLAATTASWSKVSQHPLHLVANYYFQNNNIHLWQFLRELLDNQDKYAFCVRWVDRPQGIFKIEDSHKLAKFWGQRKNRPAMNYDKLSRSLRQYYRKGILKKTARSQRLVYQFLSPYHVC